MGFCGTAKIRCHEIPHINPNGTRAARPTTESSRMRVIPTTAITIPTTRQRRTFDETSLNELALSIQRNGLLHPVVVRIAEGRIFLVAGERRLRAIEILSMQGIRFRCGEVVVPEGHVPVNELGELSPEEAWEAELEENIQRVNLTWQERAEAIANLHKLREMREGKKLTPAETAPEILGAEMNPVSASQAVRRALVLQEHLAKDNEVAKAKTEQDAWRIIKKRENERLFQTLAASAQEAQAEHFSVMLGDCREALPTLKDETFDCIITDPPYGIGADSFGDAGGRLITSTHTYEDTPEYALSLLREVIPHFFRLAKAEAHMYLFCDIEHFLTLRETARAAGWTPFRTPFIYVKRDAWRAPWPEHGPRRAYEAVLYAMKGKRPVTAIYDDVFFAEKEEKDESFQHGAAKPVSAYVNLLRRSCRPGDAILDPFAGTGTVLDAAAELNLRALAIEMNPTYYGMCVARLERLKK